jgi:hypothetical protein
MVGWIKRLFMTSLMSAVFAVAASPVLRPRNPQTGNRQAVIALQ